MGTVGALALTPVTVGLGEVVSLAAAACGLLALVHIAVRWGRVRGVLPAVAAVLICGMLMPMLGPHPEDARRRACAARLGRIGQAASAYASQYGGFWPCDARGALYSLALLYPEFLDDAGVFVCPSVGENERRAFPAGCSLGGRPCSYGYDSIGVPDVMVPGSARVADMPGNHGGDGFNVLYWDGHAHFSDSPYASQDPDDNMLIRNPELSPDRDAFVRQ